jgi:DNA invertase Pin-like site-specific DNA recombinase
MTEIHPEKRLVGYARVSTYGQTFDAQLDQLRAAGCSIRSIYREKGERADFCACSPASPAATRCDRNAYKINRRARSTSDLFGIVRRIVASWTRKRRFDHWPSRGLTPAPAPGG